MSKIPPPSNSKIKVFIVDDSLIVREHLVTLLDELAGIEIVGQATNGGPVDIVWPASGILRYQT